MRDFTAESNRLLESAKRGDPNAEGLTIFFTYRFINFEWKPLLNRFVPIQFICNGIPYDELRSTFTNPERVGNEHLRQLQ